MESSFLEPAKKLMLLDDYVDRISNLPDMLICHIFSFLKTKDIIRTSILSKRWEYVWTNAPILEFEDRFEFSFDSSKLAPFKNSIDRIMFHHGGLSIEKCTFRCSTEFIMAKPLYAWICAVLSCNVQELCVHSNGLVSAKELPWSLFTCKTMVSLEISGAFVLNIPTYVQLPCLKTLSLRNVIYVDDLSMHRLFASCFVLEDLSIERQRWDGVFNVVISVSSLKRLSICVSYIDDPFKCNTKVNAPNLEYLRVDDSELENVFLSSSPSLLEAHILKSKAPGILQEIAHVKHLCLFGPAMEDFRSGSGTTVPVFHNLTRLELGVGNRNGHVCWDLLLKLLNCCPNLEILVFFQGLVNRSYHPYKGFYSFYWTPPLMPPECLGTNLKQIKVNNFVGKPCEFFMISYLLLHSQVLEKMTIDWYFVGEKYEEQNLSFRRRILGCDMGSSTCQLEFGP